jgi:hypothetical protein
MKFITIALRGILAMGVAPGFDATTTLLASVRVSQASSASMSASLTADAVIAKLPGRTMTNEEAGTPSFKGSMAANDPNEVLIVSVLTTALPSRSMTQKCDVPESFSPRVP